MQRHQCIFPVVVPKKKRPPKADEGQTVRDALLGSTRKYFEQLQEQQAANSNSEEHGENSAAVADEGKTAGVASWIDFKAATGGEDSDQKKSTENANNVPSSATNIPQFDEQSGARLIAEEGFPDQNTVTKNPLLVLPWRQWHKQNTLGALEADKAAAVAVLHGLHENFDVTIQDIDIMYSDSKPKVVALKATESESIWLPACVPKQSKVCESSENPNAVSLFVTVLRSAESAANSPEGHILRSREFKIVPEFKVPTRASSESKPAVCVEDGWTFDDGSPDTMHPYWAVRRLSAQHLEKERSETKAGNWLPRFTCEVRYVELSSVCVFARITCGNATRNCKVPFITNIGKLEEGEELILEVAHKEKQQKPKARTWRQIDQEEQAKSTSAAKSPKQM